VRCIVTAFIKREDGYQAEARLRNVKNIRQLEFVATSDMEFNVADLSGIHEHIPFTERRGMFMSTPKSEALGVM
jgi:hypothetical protein